MNFEFSEEVKRLQSKLELFMETVVYPNEKVYEDQLNSQTTRWKSPPIMEEMKAKARKEGLWNLFLPDHEYGAGLS
ncbi:MAG: acyl-CoA dehydrogenase, partial [Thermoactinomyces sp.]